MTPVEEEKCVRGINIRGNTQPAARGNGQYDIGELPAFIKFTTHVPLQENMAEWTGLEPATPGVTGRYSNQLNYHSMILVGAEGLEPTTSAL